MAEKSDDGGLVHRSCLVEDLSEVDYVYLDSAFALADPEGVWVCLGLFFHLGE